MEIKYCPTCREKFEKSQGKWYCHHCKAIFYIQLAALTVDSPVLKDE